VIAVWLVVLFAIGPLAGKFEDAQENDPADYLPANAESVKTLDRLDGFPWDDEADAITVFHRDGGLTAEDRAAVEQVRAAINERVRTAINAERAGTVAETGPPQVSDDGATALLTTAITVPEEASGDAEDLLTDTPEEIKAELGSLPSGLEAEVTGRAGFAADAVEVFNDILTVVRFLPGSRVAWKLTSASPIFLRLVAGGEADRRRSTPSHSLVRAQNSPNASLVALEDPLERRLIVGRVGADDEAQAQVAGACPGPEWARATLTPETSVSSRLPSSMLATISPWHWSSRPVDGPATAHGQTCPRSLWAT